MFRHTGLYKNESGGTMVELAVTAALILTVLFGIIDVGRAAYAYDWVSNASRMGTRFAMVRGSNCSGLSGGCPAHSSDVTNYLDTLATNIDTSQLTVTTTCSSGATFSTPPCLPTATVSVQVAYNFKFLAPLVPLSWQMHSTSERIVQN